MSRTTGTQPPNTTKAPADGAVDPDREQHRGIVALMHIFDDKPTVNYYVILTATLLLVSLGVMMVFSASTIALLRKEQSAYGELIDQSIFALLGLACMYGAMKIKVQVYRALAPLLVYATFLLQFLVFTPLGTGKGGNRNWILIPGIGTVQPSEFMKLGLCLFLAITLAKHMGKLDHWKKIVLPGLLVSAVALVLVLAGHDMGTVLVLAAIVAGVYWFAGLDLKWFGIAGAVGLVGIIVLIVSSKSRVRRVLGFLGMAADDPSGTGYQTQHGMWALGTGGVGGVGLGASREKWVPLPEAHNDFIFAIIGEELGLMGALLVVCLFVMLGWAMLRLIHRHPDPFVALATGGIFTWIMGQAFINIFVVIGYAPVIGIPLPLVSAGGSAMVSTLAAIGVVLAFARSEPGAEEVLSARRGTLRRSLAVLGRGRQGRGKTSQPTPRSFTKGTP